MGVRMKVAPVLLAAVLAVGLLAGAGIGLAGAAPPALPDKPLQAIILKLVRVDVVHTTDLAVTGQVIPVLEFLPPVPVNLLDLQDGVLTALGISTADLPAGFVTQVRLVITDAFITFDGDECALFVPGWIILINGEVEVGPGIIDGDMVFEFDVDKQVIPNRHFGFILKHVIQAKPPVVDQSNDPGTDTSFGCGILGLSLYQSFTPTASPLVTLKLRLRAGGSFPDEGVTTTVNIRAGTPTGAVLGTATAFVPGPQATGTQLVVLFSFFPAIMVTPGSTVVIEWLSPAPAGVEAGTILTWMGRTDNPYPDGNMFGCNQSPVLDNDLNFQTFTA